MREDSSIFEPPDLGLGKDTEIIFANGIRSLRGGAKRLELSIPVGAPLEVYDQPTNTFVAGFIGSPAMNFIDCKVVQNGPNILLDGKSFQFPLSAIKDGVRMFSHLLGKEVILGLRPEDIEDREFVKEQKEGIIKATVNMVEPMGANVHLRVTSGEHHIIACVSPKTRTKAGETIDLVCDLSKVHLFDKKTEKAISKSI